MILDKETAKKTAELLLQINAIKLQPQEPFTWASGWKSPIYCDNRITLSYPQIRNYIHQEMAKQVELLYGKPDAIAGVATGAIGIGMLVADYLNLPFVYIRPEPKKHGRQNKIEGHLESGSNVVVIEDLISTGMSSLKAVDAIREGGGKTDLVLSIFNYGFSSAVEAFESKKCNFVSLSNYDILLEEAVKIGYLEDGDLDLLKRWKTDPKNWNIN